MRVLFWGTSAFAVPSLEALVGEGFDVCAVITQPDRPVGRSRSRLQAPPVKLAAERQSLPVHQPEKPRGDAFLATLRELKPDISVVVSYGHILTQEVIDVPGRGTINVHASLLPALRGASPIRAAILQGLEETGITIMRMVRALDAGPVILQAAVPIAPEESYGELELRLSEMGAQALIEALTLTRLGRATEQPQDDSAATFTGKVGRDDARIDWTLDSLAVSRRIRAYDPSPGAHSTLSGAQVKLFGARLVEPQPAGDPGSVLAVGAPGLLVACGDSAVLVNELQPAGKRRMRPEDWARGRSVAAGDRFGD